LGCARRRLPAECEVLGLGLEELVDEGFDAWLAPVPEGVFAPRGVLVRWTESIDEVKIDVGELDSKLKLIQEREEERMKR